MSSRRRDRHSRGLRGPLALANPYSSRPAQPARPATKADFFTLAVQEAVERVAQHCPDALVGVTFGVEDVPYLETAWSGDQVPLAAAIDGDADHLSRVVVYRRPVEARAQDDLDLAEIVREVVTEQVAALLGVPPQEIDPGLDRDS